MENSGERKNLITITDDWNTRGYMELILCLIALYLFYLFLKYVFPVILSGIAIIYTMVFFIAIVTGSGIAFYNYYKSIRNNMNFSEWTWEKDSEPAKRSYFFGPGYMQLRNTIRGAFQLNALSINEVKKKADKYKQDTGIWGLIKKIGAWIFQLMSFICIYIVGTCLTVIIGGVHGLITTAIMFLIYIIFTITWITDRLYLKAKYIKADCPVCKERYAVPAFICSNPTCGRIHKKLVPGPYGIWHHTCDCGEELPSTFMNGRSKLQAVCPVCGAPIAASDVRPVVYQLIGATKSGKTVFLASFYHQFLNKLGTIRDAKVSVTEEFEPYFEELNDIFNGGAVNSTTDMNSQMYPIIVDSNLKTRRQFSVYDIAGEMFNSMNISSVNIQKEFKYCDGFLFLLDPFSTGRLRKLKEDSNENLEDFSNVSVTKVLNNFSNYLVACQFMKANGRCHTPVAVIICKADYPEVKRRVGPAKINAIYKNNPEQYQSLQQCRDEECRRFLSDIGLNKAVDVFDMIFTDVHFFVASAMGHSYDGEKYTPWGVMDAVEWLLPRTDKEFAGLVMPEVVAELETASKKKAKSAVNN